MLTTASVRLHLRKRRNGPLGVANSGWFFGPALKGNHGFSRLKKAGVVRWGVNGWAVMKKKTPRETRIRKKIQRHEGNQSPPDCYGLLVMKFRSFFFCGTRWDEAIRTVMRVAKLNGNLRGAWTPGFSTINLITLELEPSSQNSPEFFFNGKVATTFLPKFVWLATFMLYFFQTFQTGQFLLLKRKQF